MDLYYKELIGLRIRSARLGANLSQEKVAETLKCSTGYISNVENGKTSITVERLISISNLLQVEINTLMDGIGYQDSSLSPVEFCNVYPTLTGKHKEIVDKVAEMVHDLQITSHL